MKTLLLVVLLAGCASNPGIDITSEQAACQKEKCLVLTLTQFKAAVVHFTSEALEPVFEAGVEVGSKSCKRIKL